MGEPTLKNADPRVGNVSWAEWTSQQTNESLIQAQLRLLVPVQDMLPFQRQIVEEPAQALPSVGQQSVFTWIVPLIESWRIMSMSVLHTDTAPVEFSFNIISNRNPNMVMPVSRQLVSANVQTSLYPSAPSTVGPTTMRAQAGPPAEAFPRDIVQVRSIGGIAAPSTGGNSFRFQYQQISSPSRRW